MGCRALSTIFVAILGSGLAACQQTPGTYAVLGGADIPIALESIEGPPEDVRTMLADELASAAGSRRLVVVTAGESARYHVRGYLSTERTAGGETALAFVWDVFDARKRRARRLTGSNSIFGKTGDPWSGLDREALARLAADSLDEIAGFLVVAGKSSAPESTPALGFGSR